MEKECQTKERKIELESKDFALFIVPSTKLKKTSFILFHKYKLLFTGAQFNRAENHL